MAGAPTKSLTIGLHWHSARSGNLGVGALTIGNMAIVRQVASGMGFEPRFVIVGMRDYGPVCVSPEEADSFELDARSLLSPSGFWAALSRQDCVLDIGAGDSFADIYNLKRFMFIWLTKVITLAKGRPLLFSPQTIGPFTKGPYIRMARMALEGAKGVLCRDPISLEALRKIAPGAKGLLTCDVAFALPYVSQSHLRGGPRLRVGVNVSGLLFNEAENGTNKFNLSVHYTDLTRRLIRTLLDRGDVDLFLVTHTTAPPGDHDDDGGPTDQIAAEFPQAVRVPDFAGPSEVKSFISGLDFLVAGRMHACVAAYSSGTPVAPIAYSRKFSGLFGMLGYEHMVPMSGMDTSQALAFILDGLERRGDLAAEIAKGLAKVEALLDVYRGELKRFFTLAMGRA